MKKLGALMIVMATMLSGCVVYDPHPGPYRDGPDVRRGDRDGDGVPNRYDSRPDNPGRY